MQNYPWTIRDLEVLVGLAQEGSVKKTAQRLNLTESAISHRIHDINERLGLSLTERHGRVQLTPVAWRIVPQAREILEGLGRLQLEFTQAPDVKRIGVSRLLLHGSLISLIAELSSPGRDVFDIVSGHSLEIERWVEEGRLDAGIVRLERKSPSLRYQWIVDDRLVVATSPDQLFEGNISQWPWVLYSPTMGHGRVVDQAFHDAGVGVVPRIRVDAFDLALALVRRGAVSVFPWTVVRDLVLSGDLYEIAVPSVILPPRRTALVTLGEPPPWVKDWARVLEKILRSFNAD